MSDTDLVANGRALTSEQKRDVVERILAAWEKAPALRLGQLLMHAARMEDPLMPLIAAEDEWLANAVTLFALARSLPREEFEAIVKTNDTPERRAELEALLAKGLEEAGGAIVIPALPGHYR